MRLGEFLDGVRAYDVELPGGIRRGSVNAFYRELLGLDDGGSGNPRRYTTNNVRQLVSWVIITQTTGGISGLGNQYKADASAGLRRHAMRLMAAASEGWIVMSKGGVRWSPEPPVLSTFTNGAVVLPVPDWLPEHQPR